MKNIALIVVLSLTVFSVVLPAIEVFLSEEPTPETGE